VCWHAERDLRCVVHGDDFYFIRNDMNLAWIYGLMREWYEVKMRGILGPDSGDVKRVEILNRWLEWKETGIELKADPKHAQRLIKEVGLSSSSKGSEVFGTKNSEIIESKELDVAEATRFRALAATTNNVAQDRAVVQFSAKEICRRMAKQCEEDWTSLKRLARYFVNYPELAICFRLSTRARTWWFTRTATGQAV
jgi:hypothetical protein